MYSDPFLSRVITFFSCILIFFGGITTSSAQGRRAIEFGVGLGMGLLLGKGLKSQGSDPKQTRNRGAGQRNQGGGGKAAAEQSAASQQQSVEVSENWAAEEEARRRIDQNDAAERNRNVEKAIAGFLKALEDQHLILHGQTVNVRVASGATISQVTAGEVRSEVEKAYADAHLTDFDRFAGELWTRDRLTVQILKEAEKGIEPYFQGVGAKGPGMTDLKEVFAKSATIVYARALELAEIIGVSHSFDRFIRTIYENSDRVPESLWTIGADGKYERMLSRTINTIDRGYFITDGTVGTGDAHGLNRLFQFRFRARRALYECLSAHYANMAASQNVAEVRGALPTLVIESTLSGQNAGRNAQLAGGSRMKPKPVLAESDAQPATGAVEQTDVWQRVQSQVTGECNEAMRRVANDAHDQGLQPVPARWEGGERGGLPSTPQVQPAYLPR
jgi:hypothetical protein